MKKIVFALLLCASFGYAQDFGIYKVEDSKVEPIKGVLKNQWYSFKSGGGFFKTYTNTPIGIKKAISDIRFILGENKIKFDSCLDSSFFSSVVKDIDDYEMLNITINNESSEVKKTWDINRKQFLMLVLEKGNYSVTILQI